MAHYTEIDSEVFKTFLVAQGFVEGIANEEVVYGKRFSPNPDLVIKVYTSIRSQCAAARDVGKDAIRVVVIFDNGKKTFGVGKFSRVYRTTSQESVHERTLDRINQALARCEQWCAEQQGKRVGPRIEQATLIPVPEPVTDPSSWVGVIGDVLRLTVKVTSRKPYGSKFIFTMYDRIGNAYVYWSERDVLRVDEVYDIGCKIKSHNVFAGVRQTVVVDCKGKRVVR